MLPSRPRLRGWNPDSLSTSASALGTAGEAVYDSVRNLDDAVHRMPEADAWSGQSYQAAKAMFGRGTAQASTLKNYVEGVAAAMSTGGGFIGSSRAALLSHADGVDRGALEVSDQWVVMIKPAKVSEEEAARLQAQAKAEQQEINKLLTAVGDADNATAANIQAAAKSFGFALPGPNDPRSLDPNSGLAQPADDVPNPRTLDGLIQQGVLRDQDMATTIRDSREWETADGQTRKTLEMMDGSRHEIYEWGRPLVPSVEDDYYDKNGKMVSSTSSQDQLDGVKFTSIQFADGTEVTMTRTADGKCTGGVIAADGRQGVLPDEFFSHPALTTVGGALTGLEGQAKRGIPTLSAQALENVGHVAKYGGPTLGVATALYDTVTAKTFHDGCVAAISGTTGIAGGYATGTLASAGITALGNPELAPVFAMGGDMLGGWTFGYVGGIIGSVVCGS